jgi:hypothetical protein
VNTTKGICTALEYMIWTQNWEEFDTCLSPQSHIILIVTSYPIHIFLNPPYADDLRHMTAVRSDLHNKFAEENEMASFLMSAKSGDQVKQAFFKIAATLAGQ